MACTFGLLESGAPPVCRVPGCHQPLCLTGDVPSGCGRCHPSGSGVGGRWQNSPFCVDYGGKGGFRSIGHPYKRHPCPQSIHFRGISEFHGGSCLYGICAGWVCRSTGMMGLGFDPLLGLHGGGALEGTGKVQSYLCPSLALPQCE